MNIISVKTDYEYDWKITKEQQMNPWSGLVEEVII